MIDLQTARRLRELGVRWEPRPGDRFLVDSPEMVDSVFWVSDFTIEVHEYAAERVLGFNGTTEWARLRPRRAVPVAATRGPTARPARNAAAPARA